MPTFLLKRLVNAAGVMLAVAFLAFLTSASSAIPSS
jgi:hypothetical protein